MKSLFMLLGVLALALSPLAGANAQVITLPQVHNAGGAYVPSQASVATDSAGNDATDATLHAARTVLRNGQKIQAGAPTYLAIATVANGSLYATPTDLVGLRNPAASGKVIQVRVFTMFVQSTSGTLITLKWYKRSSLDTGGTPITATAAKLDSNDAAPVGVVQYYSAAPTIVDSTPTPVAYQQGLTTATTAAPAAFAVTSPAAMAVNESVDLGEPVTLREGEELDVNFGGAALPSGLTYVLGVQWTESNK